MAAQSQSLTWGNLALSEWKRVRERRRGVILQKQGLQVWREQQEETVTAVNTEAHVRVVPCAAAQATSQSSFGACL